MTDILIAEDEPVILETLGFLLERDGWSVATVMDGAAVLASVRRIRPRILVLDIMLPGRSGLEVLRRMRAEPDLAAIPVLILTARGHAHDRNLALELGADGFISKPFANDAVRDEVRRLLGRSTPVSAAG